MPHFNAVGYIDDALSPAEVKREYQRRYSLASYHRRRASIVQRLGGRCAICKSKRRLTFVKTGGPASFRVGQLANASPKRRDAMLKHVLLLCGDHARERLHHKGRLTHGTWWAAYKKKCRCDDCCEYMLDYNLRRREDRRDAKVRNT